jgi:hypothetical protein
MTGSISQFSQTWAEFDPHATHFLPVKALPMLLARLPQPLGCKGMPRGGLAVLELLKATRIPVHPGDRVRRHPAPPALRRLLLPANAAARGTDAWHTATATATATASKRPTR